MRVLVVEDSPILRDSLAQGLTEAGYAVDAVADGQAALQLAQRTAYAVIVLDWMLPMKDGLSVLRDMRDQGNLTHVLMLTARDSVEDRVAGLDLGADDYLVKPFAFAELLARIQALTRRAHGTKSSEIAVGTLRIDLKRRMVRARTGDVVPLTPREFAVIECLALRRGEPVKRAELETHLYDRSSQVMSNAVDSAICALRSKLQQAGHPRLVHTRRGVGYVLTESSSQ